MRSLNLVQLIGNLTRDPELKYTPSGNPVANFSVATNREWTDSAGEKKEAVDYHNIVVWQKLAEVCSQYLRKGNKVYISGRLQTRSWEKDDIKRYRTEVVCNSVIFLTPKGTTQAQGSEAPQPKPSKARPTAEDDSIPVGDEEVAPKDMPF